MKIRLKIWHWEKIIGIFCLGLLLTNCAGATEEQNSNRSEKLSQQDEALTIWWNRGYYIQEDEALETIISDWQQETGKKVALSWFSQDDLLKEIDNAVKAGTPPDIVFSSQADNLTTPRWAWEGKLADVSEVVEPLKDLYSPAILQSVYLYNNTARSRSLYTVPIKQQTVHIHYWREMLAEAGLNEADIPTEWDAFWKFWQQAQDNLREKGRTEIYSIGFPLSSEANDTHLAFEQILDSYDVQILDEEGNLLIGNPQMRQRVAAALAWFTGLYKAGYIPPEANNWTNGDNNTEFLNQKLLMTFNPTLSIPGSQREEEDIYRNQIATIGFPDEPDGEPPQYVATVKQVMLFASSPRQETAKNFLTYFVRPEHLAPYLEGGFGRYFPVMPQLTAQPFWNDPTDPHLSVAARQFQTGKIRSNYQSRNPAYAKVQSESVWGRAIERIIDKGASPEEAANEALNRIEEIFAEWDS